MLECMEIVGFMSASISTCHTVIKTTLSQSITKVHAVSCLVSSMHRKSTRPLAEFIVRALSLIK